jgi:hypothetical protein
MARVFRPASAKCRFGRRTRSGRELDRAPLWYTFLLCCRRGNHSHLGCGGSSKGHGMAPDIRPDLVICSTFTPEYFLSPTAAAIAYDLGLPLPGAIDLNAASAGGIVGILTSLSFLFAGAARTVLLASADTTARFLARRDRQTRIPCGDEAGRSCEKRPPAMVLGCGHTRVVPTARARPYSALRTARMAVPTLSRVDIPSSDVYGMRRSRWTGGHCFALPLNKDTRWFRAFAQTRALTRAILQGDRPPGKYPTH